jgi:hypothetical protein
VKKTSYNNALQELLISWRGANAQPLPGAWTWIPSERMAATSTLVMAVGMLRVAGVFLPAICAAPPMVELPKSIDLHLTQAKNSADIGYGEQFLYCH